MGNKNLLDEFDNYIEDLCRKHTSIRHTDKKKHFVKLAKDEILQEGKAVVFYPVVTLEKLTNTYTGLADSFRKNRHVELMFLDHLSDGGNFKQIESVWTNMESVAEDFLKKIREDRRVYPFLKSLKVDNAELDYVENVQTHLWGVLLSFDIDLPFDNCIAPGRFD